VIKKKKKDGERYEERALLEEVARYTLNPEP